MAMARQLVTSVTSLTSCKPICWRRRAAIRRCSARCTTLRWAGACRSIRCLRRCAVWCARGILTTASRHRLTRISGPETSGIRRRISARRGFCCGTIRPTMWGPAFVRLCRGTKPGFADWPAAAERRCNVSMTSLRFRLHRPGIRPSLGICWLMAGACALATAGVAAQEISYASRVDVVSGLVSQAVAYEHGEGVPKDPIRAAALYCDAARRGDAEAQFSLGWMYANGRGIARDDAVAGSLFALAAEQGHAAARKTLQFIRDERGHLPDCMVPDEPVVSEAAKEAGVDPFADLPPQKQKIADLVNTLAPGYTVAPRLALAVITVESNFDPNARSA